MRVLCLNPPFLPRFSREQRSPAVTKSGTIYYPMWLAYGAAALKTAGHEVTLIDAVPLNWSKAEVRAWIVEHRPQMAVIQTSTPSIYNDIEYAVLIKSVVPDCYVVVVGPHVSALPEETLALSDALDAAAINEYERTLIEVANGLEQSADFTETKGLVLRCKGKIQRNPVRPFMEDLDWLPFVSEIYRKHLNCKDYFYSIARWPEVTLITGRGCIYRCAYCVYPQVQNGHRCRYRAVSKVVEEFRYVQEEFPEVKEIFIEDDTLTVNRERCLEFCERLAEANLRLTFTANSRADIDYPVLKALKRAKCRLLCVGFESGVQDILNGMQKNNTLAKAQQFVKDAKRAGVMIHGCFLVGNQGETKASMAATLEFAKSLNTDTAQFFPIMVYPGTQLYSWVKAQGYLTTENFREWLTEDGMHNCVVDLPGLSAREMVKFCDYARKSYYLRPKYMLLKLQQTLKDPTEAQRTLKSLKIFYRYLMRGSFAGNARS